MMPEILNSFTCIQYHSIREGQGQLCWNQRAVFKGHECKRGKGSQFLEKFIKGNAERR